MFCYFFFFARGNTLENSRVSDDFNLYWRLFEKFPEYFLQDGEGNEHLFEKIWCYTTVAFSYDFFFFRRPKKWDISPIQLEISNFLSPFSNAFS